MVTLLLLNDRPNGIHNANKWKNIFNTILASTLHIIALQETHLRIRNIYFNVLYPIIMCSLNMGPPIQQVF